MMQNPTAKANRSTRKISRVRTNVVNKYLLPLQRNIAIIITIGLQSTCYWQLRDGKQQCTPN
jgi:hypothetical protein